jgi:hypothetical protein
VILQIYSTAGLALWLKGVRGSEDADPSVVVDDGNEAGSESSHVRGSVQGFPSISMAKLVELMSQGSVGREDLDRVASRVRDEEVSSVVDVQSRRPREASNEDLHVARHDMDSEDTAEVEVGDIETLACKNKRTNRE